MLSRVKHVLNGEDGVVFLEVAVLICIVCFIVFRLLVLMNSVIELQTTKNAYTSSTGWFRSHDLTGIQKN